MNASDAKLLREYTEWLYKAPLPWEPETLVKQFLAERKEKREASFR
jgi:hypothetical protein